MTLIAITAIDVLARLAQFDTIIDARSQSEYAEDHLPGAVNWPSLNDEQRHLVGTQYKQDSPFDAKKRGAALVAHNIARHIEVGVMDKPKQWQPLVYCWRGGKRSGALALVLSEIGFNVQVLQGGYRAFRRAVVAELEALPRRFDWRVICGATGSGKSRLLQLLALQGAQVLDLEAIANHRGSVLGLGPGERQPSQKRFDTLVWNTLRRFDPQRQVFVESESKKVGDLHLPSALIEQMRAAPCLDLGLPLEARVRLLLDEYRHFVVDTESFCLRLDALRQLRGNQVVETWQNAARAGDTQIVVRELLLEHYDPIYLQSMRRNYAGFASPRDQLKWDGSEAKLIELAQRIAVPS